jgi:hypothetical protein
MSTKYLMRGNGNTVATYSDGEKNYTHKELSIETKAMCK